MRLSESLARLLPPVDAAREAYLAHFRPMADLLLNGTRWVIAGAPHRPTEVEFYFNGRQHGDTFAHSDPAQRTLGGWYHHRIGETFRGGSYKGLDLSIGAPDACAGVLIRGVATDDGRVVVDGPSLCVDYLLQSTGHATVASLVG